MALSCSNIKNFLYFPKRKLFLYFGKQEPWKNSLHFRKRKSTLINFLYFRNNFPSSKSEKKQQNKQILKCFLYFGKWNFLAPNLKNFLCFRNELKGPENQTKNLPRRFLVSCDVFVIFTVVKHREILCDYLIFM